jgi:hypothetical protein
MVGLADGNPGAVTTLVELYKSQSDGDELLDILEEHDITGPLIWVGYNDHCDRDVDEFAEKLRQEDTAMFNRIEDYRERLEDYTDDE